MSDGVMSFSTATSSSQAPLTPELIRSFNRWAQARLGMTNARDRHDNTRITYRNEAAKAAGGHPEGYTLWPVLSGQLTDPEDGSWFERTTAWQAWRIGSPDELLGVFKVATPDSFGVLGAAQQACSACWADQEAGGARKQPSIFDALTGKPFNYDFDPSMFTLIENKVYLNHAQVYAVFESYRRNRCIPVGRTDSVRRQMNRYHTQGVLTAVGPRMYRRFHIQDVVNYASYKTATVEEACGMTEAEMRATILAHFPVQERPPSTTIRVPETTLQYALQFIDALRADVETRGLIPTDERIALMGTSNELHRALSTSYDSDEASDLRDELLSLLGKP